MRIDMDTRHYTHKIAGFTLLEVMVALLIFSIGLLGLAGLQGGSLQNNKTADMRSIAIIAAHDMAERIRANNRDIAMDYDNIGTGIVAPGTNCVTTAGCTTSASIKDWDTYEWQTSLSTLLPSGRGTVARDANGALVITVMWDEARTGKLGEACSGDPTVDLKCYKLDFLP
jgi:type IV pilus assembly protein PilV